MFILNTIANISFYGTSEEKFLAGLFIALCFAAVFVPVFALLSWINARKERARYGLPYRRHVRR